MNKTPSQGQNKPSALLIITLVIINLFALQSISAKEADYDAETVAKGFVHPWGMTFINEKQMIITERPGQAYLVDITTGTKNKLSNLPNDIIAKNQGGLLDVQISNEYKQDGWIYFSYSQGTDKKMTTRVSRAKLNGTNLVDWQVLFTATPYTDKVHHFGSRLFFNSKNELFITVGDRGERDRSQDLNDNAGAIHRINADGTIPADNPYLNDGNPKTQETIYSWGHRNPQGLWIMKDDTIWSQEHGPRGGDELNKVLKGENYGWPIITYGKEYWGPSIGEGTEKEGMIQPHYYYVPSIAPSGLVFYEGNEYPKLSGSFLLGALKDRHINVLTPESKDMKKFKETRILELLDKRIRDIEIGADGKIYFITDDPKGELMVLKK